MNDCFVELQENDCLFFIIELSEVTVEHLNLISQFEENFVFIFENANELKENIELVSKFKVFTFFKDVNINEKLIDFFSKMNIIDTQAVRLEVSKLDIDSQAKILIHANELTLKTLRFRKPGAIENIPFEEVKLRLKYFKFTESFKPAQVKVDTEELVFEADFTAIHERIQILNMKNNPNLICAYITDKPALLELFFELGVKVNVYKNLEDYSGDENFVVIRDRLIDVNESLGTSFCKLDFKDKSVLITNRCLSDGKYCVEALKSTTENVNARLLEDFFNENKIDSTGDIFRFDSKSNITFGELSMPARIIEMSESLIKVVLPFRLESSLKILLSFFGNETFTVLESEAVSSGFLHSVSVDNFSEIRMNEFRSQLNQILFCQDNSIPISELEKIDQLNFMEVEGED